MTLFSLCSSRLSGVLTPCSRNRRRVLAGALGMLMLAQVQPAAADLITAENLLPDDGINFGAAIFTGNTIAQTFAATVGGNISTIELPLWIERIGNPTDSLMIQLWGLTPSGEPDETNILATRTLAAADVSTEAFTLDFTVIDFSADLIDIMAGDQMAIVASSDTGALPDWFLWTARQFGNTYEDGQFFFTAGTERWLTNPGHDAGFRVTVVPAPGTLCAVLACIPLFGRRRRREKQRGCTGNETVLGRSAALSDQRG